MLILAVLVSMLTGCATPAPLRTLPPSTGEWKAPGSFEETWTAVIGYAKDSNWPISAVDKNSGIITSGPIHRVPDGYTTDTLTVLRGKPVVVRFSAKVDQTFTGSSSDQSTADLLQQFTENDRADLEARLKP